MLAVCKAQSMRVFVILIALGLVACGGGGGGGSDGGGNGSGGDGSGTTTPAKFTLPGEVVTGMVQAVALATDSSGDIYVGGDFVSLNDTTSSYLVRFNSDGTVDSTFALGTGFDSWVTSLAPATDGSGDVYVGGDFTSYDGTTSNRIIRLNSDGTVDTDFAVGTGFNKSITTLIPAQDSSGDVYVGGNFTSYNGTTSNYLIRLNSDGTVDTDFAIGTSIDNTVYSISPAADGSGDIYVGGFFTFYNHVGSTSLMRLTSTGALSKSYGLNTFNSTVLTVAPAADGSGDVYVGGEFNSYDGTASSRIIRLNSDRTVDTAFAVGTGFDYEVESLVPATDGSGDVYVGGKFTSYNGTESPGIIRLNSDGTVDTGFAVGTGFFMSWVNSIALATDGSGDIYAGGDFMSYQDTTAEKVISLKSDGSIN